MKITLDVLADAASLASMLGRQETLTRAVLKAVVLKNDDGEDSPETMLVEETYPNPTSPEDFVGNFVAGLVQNAVQNVTDAAAVRAYHAAKLPVGLPSASVSG